MVKQSNNAVAGQKAKLRSLETRQNNNTKTMQQTQVNVSNKPFMKFTKKTIINFKLKIQSSLLLQWFTAIPMV